jgi:hypothetical protein
VTTNGGDGGDGIVPASQSPGVDVIDQAGLSSISTSSAQG